MRIFRPVYGIWPFAQATCASILRPDWLIGSNFGAPGTNASFDYVVVGGGTAGLTIATRLAQNGTFSVAVIEAGGFYEFENGNLSQVPAYAPLSSLAIGNLEGVNPNIDWRFVTTPQPGIAHRKVHYARGKCLGGSSARNYMEYNRATVQAMQKWADEVSDDSFCWDEVLPYYKKGVHFSPPDTKTGGIPGNISIGYDVSAFSPDGGPLQVGYAHYIYSFGSWTAKAFDELAIAINPLGVNSGKLIGHQYVTQTYNPWDSTRSSSQTSYLTLAMQETDLIVYTHSIAQRIIFDDEKKATGVLVEAGGVPFQINATREVIFSAGAFQSPQLLLVSGIGPAETLKRYHVPIIADRPGVGQNMWDNVYFAPSYGLNLETAAIEIDPEHAEAVLQAYLVNNTGPLTNIGPDSIGFDKVTLQPSVNLSASTRAALAAANFPADWPDVEFLIQPNYVGTGIGPPDSKNYGSIGVGLLALLSRGNVTISSPSMNDAPVISPNWLEDPADQEVAVVAFKRARALFQSYAMAPVVIGDEVFPGPEINTDAEILSWIQSTALTLYPAAGTCKMGKVEDPMSVVDSKAKVIGTQGLRVVDASAFPFLPPGQPQATVYMLAEKIADEILRGM